MYLDIVKAYQRRAQLQKVQFDVQQGQSRDFVIDNEGTLRKGTKMCAPGVHKLSKEILSKCLTCQQVKLEHQRPSGLLQQLPISEWKWDMIVKDFISGLSRTSSGYDAIWVIVDRLTKTAQFLPIKKTYSTDRLARLYVNRIIYLHGVPVSIVSNRGAIFTSVFWQKKLHKAMGTRLDSSTSWRSGLQTGVTT